MNTKSKILEKYELKESKVVDIPKSRWREMAPLFKELGFKVGAEIGVLKGQFLKNLCKEFKMFGIDPWDDYDGYNDYKGGDFSGYEKTARDKVKNFECDIIKKTSMDAVEDFKDESLDFVFIDGNHTLEFVIEDIAAWSKKVKRGGIVAGHDYFRRNTDKPIDVKDAVNTWIYCKKISPLFVFRGDKCPTWFFIKE